MSHIHLIWAGGIGVSAIARYYKSLGWTVSGSDTAESEVTRRLIREGVVISIGHDEKNLPDNTDLLVHTESIYIAAKGVSHSGASAVNVELEKAKKLGIKIRSYPQALGDITNDKGQIAVAGSHGKSSTTSLIGVMLKHSSIGGSTIVGTQLPQFDGKNYWHDTRSDWFVIEACEYKRHFLEYTPRITVITNIDIDHLDYYKDTDDYLSAFVELVKQTKEAVVLSDTPECRRLYNTVREIDRTRLWWYWVNLDSYTMSKSGTTGEIIVTLPQLQLQVPWEHLRLDANLGYIVGEILGISEQERVSGLESYSGSWRRSEVVGKTKHGNIVISDYGHHPSEIIPTLRALKRKYSDRKLIVVFQPHQHARTRHLLTDFTHAFGDADLLIVPNIYASRDNEEDTAWMTLERFIDTIKVHKSAVQNGGGKASTLTLIAQLDANEPEKLVILLMGAGDINDYRTDLVG